MSESIAVRPRDFELKGHDALLGQYPSVSVPVGAMEGELVAVFITNGRAEFQTVPADATYQVHNRITASTLVL